ncbi:hypothetical protein RFI_29763 [Reticulomyxa filosa]|uniref:Uncharacterized protein n=1 Tax=Reticulomyxa filosa TaxID=46433 RepID=X6M169_RETFI|nr:hypothetical protein RFI_29763 [Reticulomyxa filosa]|eukprot:ETO07629.1 hypothetical protein RFI_29763 [Reticulomyxa filosa]
MLCQKRYLDGITKRRYLLNDKDVWNFFEFSKYIDSKMYRYQMIHLNTFVCNEYKHKVALSSTFQASSEQNVAQESLPEQDSSPLHPLSTAVPSDDTTSDGFWNNFLQIIRQKLGSSNSVQPVVTSVFDWLSKKKKKKKREWKVLFVALVTPNTFLTVSEIASDHTKPHWWQSLFQSKSNASDNAGSSADGIPEAKPENTLSSAEAVRPQPTTSAKTGEEKGKDSMPEFLLGKLDLWETHVEKKKHDDVDNDEKQPMIATTNEMDLQSSEKEQILEKLELKEWKQPNALTLVTSSSLGHNPQSYPIDYYQKPLHSFFIRLCRPKSAYFCRDNAILFIGTEYGDVILFTYDSDKQAANQGMPVGAQDLKALNLKGFLFAISMDCYVIVPKYK